MAEKSKSDLSRAFTEDGALKTHVGGQALLEGIMMRGKFNWAVAVREPEGTIYTEEHDLASGKDKNGWLYWPFVRGCRAFVESLALGYKALSISAEHAFVEEVEESEGPSGVAGAAGTEKAVKAGETLGVKEIAETARTEGAAAGGAEAVALADEASIAVEHAFVGEPDESNGAEGVEMAAGARDAETVALADEAYGVEGVAEAVGADEATEAAEAAEVENAGSDQTFSDERALDSKDPRNDFSWKRDFGNPDEMIDALGAQRTLEVVCEPCDEGSSTYNGKLGGIPENAGGVASTGDVAAPSDGVSGSGSSDASQPAPEKKPLLGDAEMMISMVLGLVLGVALFIVVPAFVTNLIVGEYDERTLLWNVVDGILRIAIFIFYIWLIGRMSDIKRMFGYHGAEHKTIHCFEHGLPLTPENARSFPRLHVRCGTAFLIMVMIIAIFVYTITPIDALIDAWGVPGGAPKLVLVIVVRILLMPVIAGISYEITVKWAGSHPDNPLVKVILWPGMQMQYLTTREPDDDQIECAIAAMQLVLDREQRENASV